MDIDKGSNFIRSSIKYSAIIEEIFIHVKRYQVQKEFNAVKFNILMLRFQYTAYKQW